MAAEGVVGRAAPSDKGAGVGVGGVAGGMAGASTTLSGLWNSGILVRNSRALCRSLLCVC